MQSATIIPSSKRHWTDNELMALPKDGNKYELIDGDLLVSPVRPVHSLVCVRILYLLFAHVRKKKLGNVYDSSIGFRLSPKILLSPDVSFVSKSRLSEILISPDKFLCGAPDLAVEVLSPSDSLKIVEAKLDKYFEHGTRLGWIVDPKRTTITIHQSDSISKLSDANAILSGGEVLRGFKCKLSEIFYDE